LRRLRGTDQAEATRPPTPLVQRVLPTSEKNRKCNPSQKSDKEERMTTKTSDIPVRLHELAGHLGGQDAEHWVREVGGEIEQDWLDRKVTSPAVARKAIEAFSKHAAESARLASEFDAYQADWEALHGSGGRGISVGRGASARG
jgi:hypothetical protein